MPVSSMQEYPIFIHMHVTYRADKTQWKRQAEVKGDHENICCMPLYPYSNQQRSHSYHALWEV